MRHFAVSAIGRDRPGIVAAVARSLLEHDLNVEDSQMSILRGHFAMTLIVAGADDTDVRRLRADLDQVRRQVGLEAASVSDVAELEDAPAGDPTHTVTVYGVDHPGIVLAVSAALAESAITITGLTTRLGDSGDERLYVMMMEIAVPDQVAVDSLEASLREIGAEQGVDVSLRALEQDTL